MEGYNEIYPQLPNANMNEPTQQTGENFRLKQCSESLAYLEREHDARKNIHKKYKRARSLFFNVSTASGTLSVALSAGGLGTGMTGVRLPVAVSLGALGGFCAVVSVISGAWVKMISKNVSKHEITVSLCRAKLNTMKDIVSKALTDNKISHEEFLLIKSEVDKYHEIKKSIRQKYKSEKTENPQRQQPTAKDMKNLKGRFVRRSRKNFSIKGSTHKLQLLHGCGWSVSS